MSTLNEFCLNKGLDYPVDQDTFEEADRALRFSYHRDPLTDEEKHIIRTAYTELSDLASSLGTTSAELETVPGFSQLRGH